MYRTTQSRRTVVYHQSFVIIKAILLSQATGDTNKLIMIWEAATCKHLYRFTGHRDAVSVRTRLIVVPDA